MRSVHLALIALLSLMVILTGCDKVLNVGASKSAKEGGFTCPTDPSACAQGVVETKNTMGENKVFFEAVMEDDEATVKSMLKKSKKFLEARNMMDATPLHVAAKTGKPKCLKVLLDSGADINALNEQGRTPLHAAATNHQLDIAKILIDKGARISPRSANLGTPLHDAAVSGDLEIAKLLLDEGADINATSKKGITPVLAAVTRDKKDVAKLLMEKGAKYDPEKMKALLAGDPDAFKNIPDETFCCENL